MRDTITSAIVHDIGKLMAPAELRDKEDRDIQDERGLENYQLEGFDILDEMFQS